MNDSRCSPRDGRRPLWLFFSCLDAPGSLAAAPTLAWIADVAGVAFEGYLEASRNGALFARTGSTVHGGAHFQQFNYLNALFDCGYFLLGAPRVFTSSIAQFGRPVLAHTESLREFYGAALAQLSAGPQLRVAITPAEPAVEDVRAYLYPDIYFGKLVAFPTDRLQDAKEFIQETGAGMAGALFLSDSEMEAARQSLGDIPVLDKLQPDDTISTVTLRIARRWKHIAKGVAFGDHNAIAAQIPALCREKRIPLFGARKRLAEADVRYSRYTEESTEIADEVCDLAHEIGNPVIVGRQTCDGDLFAWSRRGVSIEIVDPNRPAFPIVRTVPQPWAEPAGTVFSEEPDDVQLERWADEGKVLVTLMFHSGEMAHNEAMLNLMELAILENFKCGMGVHASRYESAPQSWELLAVPRDQGGALGLIEPVLHCGGLGVLAEQNAPRAALRDQSIEALRRIRAIAGDAGTPRGYLAFMDTDLETLSQRDPGLYEALASTGLEYCISSYRPGRNRIPFINDRMIALNQTSQSVCPASPFVRITTEEDIAYYASQVYPGWIIGTLDSPVMAFNRYIWESGDKFLRIARHFKRYDVFENVTPRVIARYARILVERRITRTETQPHHS